MPPQKSHSGDRAGTLERRTRKPGCSSRPLSAGGRPSASGPRAICYFVGRRPERPSAQPPAAPGATDCRPDPRSGVGLHALEQGLDRNRSRAARTAGASGSHGSPGRTGVFGSRNGSRIVQLRQGRSRGNRLDQFRRDDHQQFGVFLAAGSGLEELAEHREDLREREPSREMSVTRLSSSPPIAKLSPWFSSTEVSSFRTVMAGTENPLTVRPWVKSSALTSGATRSEMLPRGVMVGRKFRRTPNSRNWMVTAAEPPPVDPCTTGKGNSPPARKLACFPVLRQDVGLRQNFEQAPALQQLDGRA